MSITSIKRDTNNNVSLVRMISTDTLSTVATANYISHQQNNINALNDGPWAWFTSDMIICNASDGNAIFTFTDATFSTLQKYGGGGGGSVTPAQVQSGAFNYGVDTGIADAYLVALSPALTSYSDGMFVSFLPAHNNATSTPTLNVNGVGAKTIQYDFNTLSPNDIFNGNVCTVQWNAGGDAWQIYNPVSSLVLPFNIQFSNYNFAGDSGAANAYVVTLTPAVTALQNGLFVWMKAANTNTGTSTIDVNGLGTTAIVLNPNTALSGGEIQANGDYLLMYNSATTAFTLINPTSSGGGVTASQVQTFAFNVGTDIGVADAYNVTTSPVITTPTNGMLLTFIPANNNNTSSPTLALNGGIAHPVFVNTTAALAVNDFNAGQSVVSFLQFNSVINAWVLLNPNFSTATPANIQNNAYTFGQELGTGAANHYDILMSPPSSALQCLSTFFLPQNSNTGPSFYGVHSGAFYLPIQLTDGTPLSGGEIIAGVMTYVVFSNIQNAFILLNPAVNGVVFSKNIIAPLTGDTVTLNSSDKYTIINPAGTIATLTINMPATPNNNQIQNISATQIVSSLTVSGNGNSIIGQPTALALGQEFSMIYDTATTTWYPA